MQKRRVECNAGIDKWQANTAATSSDTYLAHEAGRGSIAACPTATVFALHDRVQGLENGADDYLTKPFAMDELVARALLRRQAEQQTPTPASGDIRLRPAEGTCIAATSGVRCALGQNAARADSRA
jgi:hypothetical protein